MTRDDIEWVMLVKKLDNDDDEEEIIGHVYRE